jgi:branched-chain amino acid transport system substrate-binding protein
MPELVAVFGGRFSPVVIEELPTLKATRTLFMAPWSSADVIVDNGMQPNYVYRLSLRDSLAMPKLLGAAHRRGLRRVGLLLTNTSWGRSNAKAAEHAAAQLPGMKIVGTSWYNWRDTTLLANYRHLRTAGAQAIVLVANDDEAAVLVREVAALPQEERLPILSHWGVTGGEFVAQAGPALQQVDFSVIQTFSFFRADPEQVKRFLASAARVSAVRRIEDIKGPVGVAHAYDLTRILARAIDLAGSTDRAAVRDALERVGSFSGLVKTYAPPFTPGRHEALGPAELLLARYRADGVLVPARE